MSKTYSAGIVTAYGAAKRAGYQGTYEDFCRQQAGYAESAATVEQAKNTAVSASQSADQAKQDALTARDQAQTAKAQTEQSASQALTDIETARTGAISAVQTEGEKQTANARSQAQAAAQSATTASTKASEASASATSAGQSATNAAASATSAATSASAAQAVLESIPEDYSDLSEDVDQLKADLDESVALIRSGSVHPSVVWENGSIDSSNGQDGGGNKQRRTHGYISIGDYDFVANLTKPGTTSLSMYLCEYDATKTYLGITSRNKTGDLTPQNAQCKFVRVWTYSNTVAQNEQESYITLTIINAESVSNVVNSVSEKIDVQQYNNALHAFDLLNSSVLYRADRIEIGATHNNESGNTTYIYKTIAQTSEVGCVWIRIKEISNARSKSVIAYFYNSATVQNAETLLASQQISDTCIKAGTLIIPPAETLSLSIILYPSVNGGLTETYAVYSDIFIGLTKYRINPIDLIMKEENAVPYYYFQNDYLKNKIAVIRQTITESEGNYDAFIFCTDQHWRLNARNSPSLIRYLSDELNIKRLFNGGDFADGINIDAMKAFKKSINGAVYNICGNHEYMNYLEEDDEQVAYTITEAEVWLYLNGGLTDAVIGDSRRQYYYVDNPTQKMRYIILSVFADNGASAITSFDTAQQTWFRDVALNMPTGYTAVVFAHTIYTVYYDDDTISIYPPLEPILNIADAYDGNGEIACLIQGHTHVDGMTETSSGIPVFITTCDKYLPWINNGTNMEPYLVANRHLGTITEQAFDVVVVDKTNKKVSCIRIGAPADNGTGSKLEIRQQNY